MFRPPGVADVTKTTRDVLRMTEEKKKKRGPAYLLRKSSSNPDRRARIWRFCLVADQWHLAAGAATTWLVPCGRKEGAAKMASGCVSGEGLMNNWKNEKWLEPVDLPNNWTKQNGGL